MLRLKLAGPAVRQIVARSSAPARTFGQQQLVRPWAHAASRAVVKSPSTSLYWTCLRARGLCSSAGWDTDLAELTQYFSLTDVEVVRLLRNDSFTRIGNPVYHDYVAEKLEPLQQYLKLTKAELRKMVLSFPALLTYNHDNLVKEKLEPLQQYLGLADEQLKKIVLTLPQVLWLQPRQPGEGEAGAAAAVSGFG